MQKNHFFDFPFRSLPPAQRRSRLIGGIFALGVLFAAILLANWVTTDYGFIPVGFGFYSTAGTIFAGFALASRDAIQDSLGRKVVLLAILVGTAVSFSISAASIAIASAVAFLVSELLNFAVYTPLREKSKLGDRRWALAVVSSNLVGAISDTVLFLGIAFGFAAVGPALPGQLVGKAWATLIYLALGALVPVVIKAVARRREVALAKV